MPNIIEIIGEIVIENSLYIVAVTVLIALLSALTAV